MAGANTPAQKFRIVDAASMGADVTPATPFNADSATLLSITAKWLSAGSPVGTFVIEGSNDLGAVADIVNWFDLTPQVAPALPNASAATEFTVNIPKFGFRWLRVRYVRTSGTSTLTVIVVGKVG